MRKIVFLLVIIQFAFITAVQAQPEHKGTMKEYKNEFWESIKESLETYRQESARDEKKETLHLDLSGIDYPQAVDEFEYQFHTDPHSQGNTGTCWDFAGTSFFESEVHRLHGKEVRLSEMYTAYWEYVERAKRFVLERGNSKFAQGSQVDGLVDIWKKYGIVPQDEFDGLKPGQPYHDHTAMYEEMNSYLQQVKKSNAWNMKEVVGTIRCILNFYLGTPPESFTVEGTTYTPKEYLKDYLQLNLDDYVNIISLKQLPYYKQVIFPVPDNWRRWNGYYNVPLEDFISVIHSAPRAGYTIAIGGDVSEPGIYDGYEGVAIVPDFDIPAAYINEDARQLRFSNETTTDDHGVHLVGYLEKDGKSWYLIKDSGSRAFNGKHPGYFFFEENYIKLKILSYLVHKDAAAEILKNFD